MNETYTVQVNCNVCGWQHHGRDINGARVQLDVHLMSHPKRCENQLLLLTATGIYPRCEIVDSPGEAPHDQHRAHIGNTIIHWRAV